MNVAAAARLFASNAVWSVTRIDAAGRVLVDALASDDEGLRTVAGILLTRAGRRAEPLLGEALKAGKHVPMVISVLGSIGDPAVLSAVQAFEGSSDPEVARAAKNAIRVIAPPPAP